MFKRYLAVSILSGALTLSPMLGTYAQAAEPNVSAGRGACYMSACHNRGGDDGGYSAGDGGYSAGDGGYSAGDGVNGSGKVREIAK